MKNHSSHGFFWGIVLIAFGLFFLIENLFDIHIDFFPILMAFIFIALGIKVIVGRNKSCCSSTSGSTNVFAEGDMNYTFDKNEYNVVFGRGSLDLSMVQPTENRHIELSCVFGRLDVWISRNSNIIIHSNAAFGSFTTPSGSSHSFGDSDFRTDTFDATKPVLTINGNVVFGNIQIMYK
ncbi:MAG TPA: LiaF-related protein [Bacteroidales bacterium]|nr:LiaF-related protein [Bacteroidales bacterium]HPT04621.1 LiaF-related protein [Bacteroidales bacterium]